MTPQHRAAVGIVRGIERLIKRGWCQGSMFQDENDQKVSRQAEACKSCMAGCVLLNCPDDNETYQAFRDIARVELTLAGFDWPAPGIIGEWNDRKGRKVHEVIEMLRRIMTRLLGRCECGAANWALYYNPTYHHLQCDACGKKYK